MYSSWERLINCPAMKMAIGLQINSIYYKPKCLQLFCWITTTFPLDPYFRCPWPTLKLCLPFLLDPFWGFPCQNWLRKVSLTWVMSLFTYLHTIWDISVDIVKPSSPCLLPVILLTLWWPHLLFPSLSLPPFIFSSDIFFIILAVMAVEKGYKRWKVH